MLASSIPTLVLVCIIFGNLKTGLLFSFDSYNNFEIFEYFLAGTGRTVPSVRVISKRRMDWTKSGFTMKLAWTRRKMSLYFFSSFEIDSVELNSPFKV